MIVKLLIGAVGVYALLCLAMFLAQKSFLFHPTPLTALPAAYGLDEFESVSVRTADGLNLVAWLHDNGRRDKALIYFYGNADALPPYAGFFRGFALAGYSVLAVNYRGYGGSEGEPSETGFHRDAEAALAFMAPRAPVGKTTLVGRSIGSGVAVRLAARRPVKSLVLISPFSSVTSVASRVFWWLPVRYLLTNRFDSLGAIGEVRAPVLVIHGDGDTLIPIEEGRRLFEAANEPKRFETLKGADHIDMDLDQIRALIVRFEREG